MEQICRAPKNGVRPNQLIDWVSKGYSPDSICVLIGWKPDNLHRKVVLKLVKKVYKSDKFPKTYPYRRMEYKGRWEKGEWVYKGHINKSRFLDEKRVREIAEYLMSGLTPAQIRDNYERRGVSFTYGVIYNLSTGKSYIDITANIPGFKEYLANKGISI